MTKRETPEAAALQVVPQAEHRWLQRLVGEWTWEADATMEPGKPPVRFKGTESVRSLGEIWVVAEGHGEMPGGESGTTILTLGFDTQKQRYVGTWIGSMMTFLWQYDGTLDAAGKVLTLNSVGPSLSSPGTMVKFQDAIDIKTEDHRVMTSRMLGEDGKWNQVMVATYRRMR